jgi:hypothetical protein
MSSDRGDGAPAWRRVAAVALICATAASARADCEPAAWCHSFGTSEIVFLGIPRAVDGNGSCKRAFDVLESFKGDAGSQIVLGTCGGTHGFRPGVPVVVFAQRSSRDVAGVERGTWVSSECTAVMHPTLMSAEQWTDAVVALREAARPGGTGRVRVTVWSPGAAGPRRVLVEGPGVRRSLRTDADGITAWTELAAGTYTVSVLPTRRWSAPAPRTIEVMRHACRDVSFTVAPKP